MGQFAATVTVKTPIKSFMACGMLVIATDMTNTEFMLRRKSGTDDPLYKATEMQFRLVDGVLILGLLTTFIGLVLLLSR